MLATHARWHGILDEGEAASNGLQQLAENGGVPVRIGEEVTAYGAAYDAGTERNTELYVDLVRPCDGMGGSGMSNPDLAENGVVHMHGGIIGGFDLDPAIHGWNDSDIKVTVKRTG